MGGKLTSKNSVTINAPASRVWKALTDPAQIKEYMFGTNVTTDWKKGSPVTYSGVWEGKPYEDKGVIMNIVPEKIYHSTYYSPLSGKEDVPENYANVIWELSEKNGQTIINLSMDNIETEEGRIKSEQNWDYVLSGMKTFVEK